MVKYIWGTTISLHDSMNAFRLFLKEFKLKYRAAHNREASRKIIAEGGIAPPPMPLYDGLPPSRAEEALYERYMRQMRETGQTMLNLDSINLFAYPPTKKLYQQLMNYPQEVVPIMDQVLRDVMIENAEQELESVQARHADGEVGALDVHVIEEEVREIEGKIFKVRPFGGERTVNMRDLNPGGV
jgi:DNA replication licensing factor MCM4